MCCYKCAKVSYSKDWEEIIWQQNILENILHTCCVLQMCSRAQIDRSLSCCTDESNVQRVIAHVLQSTKGSQSTDREGITVCDRSAACARRPWTWTTSCCCCCSRAQSRGKGSRPLEVRLSCDQIEVKGAERHILSMRVEEELRGVEDVVVSPQWHWQAASDDTWELFAGSQVGAQLETEGEEAVKQLNVNL